MLDVPAPSRAGSLPQGDGCRAAVLCMTQIKCGSELARDSNLSGDIDVGCAGPFASKLAPTVDFRRVLNICAWQRSTGERASSMILRQTDVVPRTRPLNWINTPRATGSPTKS